MGTSPRWPAAPQQRLSGARTVRRSLALAWRVNRAATVGLLLCQGAAGVVQALGLVAISGTLTGLPSPTTAVLQPRAEEEDTAARDESANGQQSEILGVLASHRGGAVHRSVGMG